MINTSEILQTVRMITEEKLDIRTITKGISLYECVHPDKKILYQNVYDRITTQARNLVKTGETLEREFGIPIVNKRISVTPASLVAAACGDPVVVARAMDAAAKETGVNYIGGYTALVQKGMTASDRALIASLPEALLLVGQRRFHPRGHRHGRGSPVRTGGEGYCRCDGGYGCFRLHEAGRLCQRCGG